MKRITTLFLSLSAALAIGQTIPNGDFENWQSTPEAPTGWETTNSLATFLQGVPPVTKLTDKFSGTYAANLRNFAGKVNGKDTLFGGYMHTEVDITNQPLPAYLKGHIKYSLAAGDKAVVMFGYKVIEDGRETQYILGMKTFEGTNANYIPFTVPTLGNYYPDKKSNTLTIGISSYNFWNSSVAVSASSNVTIDSLAFGGSITPPVIVAGNSVANGDFSIWNNGEEIKTPQNWFLASPLQEASSNQISQSTDAHTGPYALQLGIDPSLFPTFLYTFIKPSAGSKFVIGYSKFDLGPKDTVIAAISKYTKNSGLEGELLDSIVFTGSQSSYKAFSLSFDGKISAGDTLALQFFAFNGDFFDNFRLAADPTFLLDDLTLSTVPLALSEEQLAASSWTVSPNPSANGVFTLRSTQPLDQLQVFDILGNKVDANVLVGQGITTLDISQQARGIYYVTQQKENSKYTSRIVY